MRSAHALRLCAWSGAALGACPWLVGIALWLRRAQGAIHAAPSSGALLVAGIGLASSTLVGRILWRRSRRLDSAMEGLWTSRAAAAGLGEPADWFATSGLALAASSLTLPAAPWGGLACLWGLAIVEPIVSQVLRPRRPRAAKMVNEAAGVLGAAPGEISQQWTRSATSDGREHVRGIVRAEFQAEQRTTSAHVAFCPPLACRPSIETRQIAGPAAQIKVSQSQTFGARFEIKLAAPGPACKVVMRFTASTPGDSSGPLP